MHTCPKCEYDLTGLPEVHACPECGLAYDPPTAVFNIGPLHLPAAKTFVIMTLCAVGIGVVVAFNLKSSGQWVFGFSMALAAFVAYLRWSHSPKHLLVVNRQGIFIIHTAANDQHIPWSNIDEIRHNWLTGAIQILDREGNKVPVHLAIKFPAFSSAQRCGDEIIRLQALYSLPEWRHV